LSDKIEKIFINKLEIEEKKVQLKHVVLEDIEINLGGKILKVNKLEIDEMELDRENLF
jgi:hypothetical protein